MPTETRSYTQTRRADATERTRRAILDAAQALFRENHGVEHSLDQLAERAGCSGRSVIRHFGSKEGLIEAAITDATGSIAETRRAVPGDIPASIRNLVSHYEAMGDEVFSWLASAVRYPLLDQVIETGTRMHLDWVEEAFASQLSRGAAAERRRRLAALATATDVYVWQLLRRREGLGRRATETAILELVDGASGPAAGAAR